MHRTRGVVIPTRVLILVYTSEYKYLGAVLWAEDKGPFIRRRKAELLLQLRLEPLHAVLFPVDQNDVGRLETFGVHDIFMGTDMGCKMARHRGRSV